MRSFDYSHISRLLAVKAPLLMLDAAELAEDGQSARGLKAVSINEAVFAGHFPNYPILPGVLQIGAMAQLSKLLLQETSGIPAGSEYVLSSIQRAKFRKPVTPGMALAIETRRGEPQPDGTIPFTAACNTPDGLASAATLFLSPVPAGSRKLPGSPLDRAALHFAAELAAEPQSGPAELMRRLPHRPPFLLIDHAAGIGNDCLDVYGYKCVTGDDLLLSGAKDAVLPPYILLECGAQLGCAHILAQPGNEGKLGIFMSIDEAKFLHHVAPGDKLVIHAHLDALAGRAGAADGDFWVGDTQVASCRLKFVIVPPQA